MTKNELNKLPENWEVVVLGDLLTDVTSGFPCGEHNKAGNGIPHLRPMNVSSNGEINLEEVKFVEVEEGDSLKQGDVLFNNTNSPEHLGKTAYINVDRDWYFSNHMTRLRVDEDRVNPKWLSNFLNFLRYDGFFRIHCRNHVNQASINQKFLKEDISVPLPPLDAQNRIIAHMEQLFSKLDHGMDDLNRTERRLTSYRRSVLLAAMEGEFTRQIRINTSRNGTDYLSNILEYRREQWDEEFQEVFKYSGKDYEKPAEAEPPENITIPDKWAWGSINQISYVVGGLTKNKSKREKYSTEIPYLRVANVYANELDLEEIKTIKISDREKSTKLLKEGDLLVVEGNGSKSQIGRVALWDGSISPCSHQNHLIKVRILDPDLRKFVLYWMLSPIGRKTIVNVASSTSGLHTLSISKVRSVPVPIPTAKEAKKIVEEIERRMTVADQILVDVENELKRSGRLRQSILKHAFNGELVPRNSAEHSTEGRGSPGKNDPKTVIQPTLSEVTRDAE